MIKLKQLLIEENDDYPEDSSLWDDWYEYVKHFNSDIEKSEIQKIIQKSNVSYNLYFGNRLLKLYDENHTVYFIYDKINVTFDLIKDINDWLFNGIDSLDIDVDNIYSGYIETTLKEMKQHPGKVYHYTTEEKFEEIKTSGKMIGSHGTGINNRGSYGIFTTVNAEEYQIGTYGNVCLEIDLETFKSENNLSSLNLSYEPEVEEYLIREYVSSTLELEFRDDIPSDMSGYTIIVNHVIPTKYIKQI